MDIELSGVGFMATLQQAGVLNAIVSSRCLSNYQDLFNLRHFVYQWCSTTHTFFLSCNEITVTLEDVAYQLLQPILGDTDLNVIEQFVEAKAMKADLRKRMNGNSKLSHWVGVFFKASTVIRCVAFIIFGSHPHYAVKPLYFWFAIKISTEVSLPLALMFLGHLYTQLDIL